MKKSLNNKQREERDREREGEMILLTSEPNQGTGQFSGNVSSKEQNRIAGKFLC